jgi:hypothetical protein
VRYLKNLDENLNRWTLQTGFFSYDWGGWHWFRMMSSAHKRDISGRGWL